jgi:hypothetical protein
VGALRKEYLNTVFTRSEEVTWLTKYDKSIEKPMYQFAILHPEDKILDHIIGLATQSKLKFSNGTAVIAKTLNFPTGARGLKVSKAELDHRRDGDWIKHKNADKAWSGLCEIVQQHKISLHVLIAPIPETIMLAWQKSNKIQDQVTYIKTVIGKHCSDIIIYNINTDMQLPDIAFRDADHLSRQAWGGIYAKVLHDYMLEILKNR